MNSERIGTVEVAEWFGVTVVHACRKMRKWAGQGVDVRQDGPRARLTISRLAWERIKRESSTRGDATLQTVVGHAVRAQ